MTKRILCLLVVCMCILACSKYELESEKGKVKVTFNIVGIEQVAFEDVQSRAGESLFTRFSIALFQDDTKVKAVSQSADDGKLGSISASVAPGTYQLVAIAHNGLGNCTISSPEKITFANNKMTDTFYYIGTVEVSESCVKTLVLKRAVSMFRLIITDPIPQSVAQIKFYYTGGSSTFNAVTGFGCVNSRQTEILKVQDANEDGSETVFEVYTFPHDISGFLNVTVTALDTSGNVLAETKYENVPITQNVITQYKTEFFNGFSEASSSFSAIATIENGGQWQTTLEYNM